MEPPDIWPNETVRDRYTIGCAPLITKPYIGTLWIEIDATLSSSQVEHTITHELGHVLGLNHDDEPQDIMAH